MVEGRSLTVLQECLQKRAYGKIRVADPGDEYSKKEGSRSLDVPKILKSSLNIFVSG